MTMLLMYLQSDSLPHFSGMADCWLLGDGKTGSFKKRHKMCWIPDALPRLPHFRPEAQDKRRQHRHTRLSFFHRYCELCYFSPVVSVVGFEIPTVEVAARLHCFLVVG